MINIVGLSIDVLNLWNNKLKKNNWARYLVTYLNVFGRYALRGAQTSHAKDGPKSRDQSKEITTDSACPCRSQLRRDHA